MGCFSMPKGVPNKRYTPEFKRMVVEAVREGRIAVERYESYLKILDEDEKYRK
mgnify:CR=1 FL=1